ncbi:hypothetical protein JCGZ_16800 [Jatropha curcas]|uniref:Uncharacterized protein n=1 Tax=Jatropha curcas TaxID=180498 RepID=A0A067L8D1_JATCU|nr:hypothetical protein JCGZ_16800 [Jatropha curcas]
MSAATQTSNQSGETELDSVSQTNPQNPVPVAHTSPQNPVPGPQPSSQIPDPRSQTTSRDGQNPQKPPKKLSWLIGLASLVLLVLPIPIPQPAKLDVMAGNSTHSSKWVSDWLDSAEEETENLSLKCKKVKEKNGGWKLECEKENIGEKENKPTPFYLKLEDSREPNTSGSEDSLCCRACSPPKQGRSVKINITGKWLWGKIRSLWLYSRATFGPPKCTHFSETKISDDFGEQLSILLDAEITKLLRSCPEKSKECIKLYPGILRKKFDEKFKHILGEKLDSNSNVIQEWNILQEGGNQKPDDQMVHEQVEEKVEGSFKFEFKSS